MADEKIIRRIIKRYGPWRVTNFVLGVIFVGLALSFLLELLIPVRTVSLQADVEPEISATSPAHISAILQNKGIDFQALTRVLRPGLFKAATSSDRPMAEKTIEKIRSQLKLQCVMQIKSESVAYINIKGVGLKKCKVGDRIGDLFTVVNIGKEKVEVMIIGHKVTLSL